MPTAKLLSQKLSTPKLERYVRAALALQGYDFNEGRIMDIVAQFERIEALAHILMQVELPLEAEPSPVFRP
jgi:hypothetical protein